MNAIQPDIQVTQPEQGSLISVAGPGETGVFLARAGAGKTACLTHVAIDRLLRGMPVLHVCVDILPEKTKVWYHELLRNIFADRPENEMAELEHEAEKFRFILAYMNQTFTPEKLEQSINKLKEQALFDPSLIILDGIGFDQTPRPVFEELRALAKRHAAPMWMSARTHRHMPIVNERGIPYPCHETDDLFDSVLKLELEDEEGVRIVALKQSPFREAMEPVILDPHTYLLRRSGPAGAR